MNSLIFQRIYHFSGFYAQCAETFHTQVKVNCESLTFLDTFGFFPWIGNIIFVEIILGIQIIFVNLSSEHISHFYIKWWLGTSLNILLVFLLHITTIVYPKLTRECMVWENTVTFQTVHVFIIFHVLFEWLLHIQFIIFYRKQWNSIVLYTLMCFFMLKRVFYKWH